MIETKLFVLHRNVFLNSLVTSFCLARSILELFCSKSWLGLKSGFAGSRSFGEVGCWLRGWRSIKLHRFLGWLSCYRAGLETLGSGRFVPELENEKAEYSRVLNEKTSFSGFWSDRVLGHPASTPPAGC